MLPACNGALRPGHTARWRPTASRGPPPSRIALSGRAGASAQEEQSTSSSEPAARISGEREQDVNGRASSGASAAPATAAALKPPLFAGNEDLSDWGPRGVPSYLQNGGDVNVCSEESQAITMGMAGELLWQAIRREAQADAQAEPLLSSFLYASILGHDSFERSLAFVLSNRLANTTMLSTQLFEIFYSVLVEDAEVRCGALSDVAACRERDPACHAFSQALLYYKGYHALQTHRIAHHLWTQNRRVMALALQSRMSEVFAVDVHPAARIGKGVLMDHGTGVVIGETAVIGNNVSVLQNVTLGGTGKEVGDRHPKVGDNVLIGACATILGNIKIGEGAQIAAGSLVLKPVPPRTMVAGSPAREVGQVQGNPALSMVHWSKRLLLDVPAGGSSGTGSASPAQAAAAPAAGVTQANPAPPPPAQAPAAGTSAAAPLHGADETPEARLAAASGLGLLELQAAEAQAATGGAAATSSNNNALEQAMASSSLEGAEAVAAELTPAARLAAASAVGEAATSRALAAAVGTPRPEPPTATGDTMGAPGAGAQDPAAAVPRSQPPVVESTRDPKEAARKWGKGKKDDPEYVI